MYQNNKNLPYKTDLGEDTTDKFFNDMIQRM